MKIKRLLRFYYYADTLNGALDDAIYRLALTCGRDVFSECGRYFEKISAIVEVKRELSNLWARLDEVLGAMTERDNAVLKHYSSVRAGVGDGEKKEIHRAVVKFTRRAGLLLNRVEEGYRLVCAYYSLINPARSPAPD